MQMRNIILILIFMLGCADVIASTAESKGMAKISYSSWSVKPKDKQQALVEAQINAIERYIASDSVSKSKNFELIRHEVTEDIEAFILSTNVISEDLDKSSKLYTVVIRSEINVNRLSQALQDVSSVGNATESEKSYITFIFVARQQASVKRYEQRVVHRVDRINIVDGADLQNMSGTGVDYASEENSSATVTTGGSTTQKMDQIEYVVSTSEGINSVMTKVFTTSGFEVVEAEYLEEETGGLISVSAFFDDYSVGDDISGETKRNTVRGAQMVDVPYVAIGTLDVGAKDKDPVTGLDRISVSVSGKIIDVQKKFPKTVASVGPVQFAGVGPTQTVAVNNALSAAAERAAKELAEQLNSRGIK